MKKITLFITLTAFTFGFSQLNIDFETNGSDLITAQGNGTAVAISAGTGTNTSLVANLTNGGDAYENYLLSVDFSLANPDEKVISVDFYNSTDTSRPVSIKLEGPGTDPVLVTVNSDATIGWETLEFDFTTAIIQNGCYCTTTNASGVYDTMFVFVDIGAVTASQTAIDNIVGGDSSDWAPGSATSLIIDFETNGSDLITAQGNGTAVAISAGSGTNTSLVANLTNGGDTYENYLFTLDQAIDLTQLITRKPTLDFYNSTATSRPVSIKLEGPGTDPVMVTVNSDATIGWETLEFDFTTAIIQNGCYCTPTSASGVYDTMFVFVDIGAATASQTAIDNIVFPDSTVPTSSFELDFETSGANFITAQGNGTAVAISAGSGTNTSLVANLTNGGDTYENYLINLPRPISLSNIATRKPTLDFYNSTATSRPVSIKLEGPGTDPVMVTVNSDATIGWETLEFDFTTAIIQNGCYCTPTSASGVYDTMFVFVDIGAATASQTAIDNIVFSDSSLSIPTIQLESKIKMFPNPARDYVRFSTNSNLNLDIQIFDMLGKSVLRIDNVRNAVNVSELNAGLYFVQMSLGTQQATKKLVIK